MIARYAIPFFFIMGFVVVPLVVALLLRWTMPRRHWRKGALVSIFLIWFLVCYGYFCGFRQFEILRFEYVSKDLPQSFDGYRMVQFSDAHVGTMTGSRQWLLQRAVDSINALHPDVILFTGDLQNLCPDELREHMPVLRKLKAKDGVFSVLGNHDYPTYLAIDDETVKKQLIRQTCAYERQLGWRLLLNEHTVIYRDSDSIVIAGMENWGKVKRMPRRGNVQRSMLNVQPSAFTVMLQHDPSCWREKILPECNAQLTLSGHTHGGQFEVLGWSPASFSYDTWEGWVYEADRALFVSKGLGALIPFRLGSPGEIVEITLRRK